LQSTDFASPTVNQQTISMLVQRDRKRDERTALVEQAAAVWQTAISKEYVERDRKDIGAAGNIPETCWGDRQKSILEVSLKVVA
jgi:hypothetical protein